MKSLRLEVLSKLAFWLVPLTTAAPVKAINMGTVDIHPELRSIKAHRLPENRFVLGVMQKLLTTVNTLHRRRFRSVTTTCAIACEDGASIRAHLIRPIDLQEPPPALLYYHGGAFVMKPAPQHFDNAVSYANGARCVVIFVEYRLAPKYVFPVGLNDCCAALRWTLKNAERIGIDAHRVAVGGDSAGGCLAAAVAQRASQEERLMLCGQLLIYPVVDLSCKRRSVFAYATVPPFKGASLAAMAKTYLGRATEEGLPRYASPLQGNLSALPAAYVETAQFDMLHDQGAAYADALVQHGVSVDRNEIDRGIHGFDLLAADGSVARGAIQRRIAFLRRVFQ